MLEFNNLLKIALKTTKNVNFYKKQLNFVKLKFKPPIIVKKFWYLFIKILLFFKNNLKTIKKC